jgi:hypothetical protein
LVLEAGPVVKNETEMDMDVEILEELEGLTGEGELEIEAPDWWNNLDATKGIGYPVRESGRYGSHPSHDGFDDESWS